MSGFPTRTNRSAFGPELENVREVSDPQREIGAATYNLGWWNLAGMSRTCPLATFRCTVSGGVITVGSQSIAFDPNAALSNLTFTYESVGRYSFAFASQYPDQRGVNVALELMGGIAITGNQSPYRGTHTGANNVPVLADSAQNWTVNELVGKKLYNTTDGSSTTVTANTANTVTGVLAGGTDNDWDTGDVYFILDTLTNGYVQMTSDYEGEVIFTDASDVLVDPSAFVLVLF